MAVYADNYVASHKLQTTTRDKHRFVGQVIADSESEAALRLAAQANAADLVVRWFDSLQEQWRERPLNASDFRPYMVAAIARLGHSHSRELAS